MKGTPYLNPDPFCRFIGPRNWGEALIDDKLMTCLLDNGSQLNFVTPTYAHERGMDILSLDTLAQEIGGQLPPIAVMGGGMIKPEGFVIMNVRVPCVKGYNEDQIAIVLEDPEMKDCPVVLGTPTLFRVMEVIKESEITELAVPWANSRLSWLMRGVHAKMSQLQVKDVANKPIAPLSVDEVVRVTSKCLVPPFGHKVIHGRVGLVLQGYKMNVMTHGLEKRSPLLPLGLEVQSAYATLTTGSGRVPVVLRNNTKDWLEIKKGTPIARMVAANLVPRVINAISAKGPDPASTLTEAERQDLLLDKLDLSGLEEWPTEQAEKARGLLKEYHDIFFLEKQDMGHTKAAEHKIILKDPDTPPFKERFRRIPPPQLDEVRDHLKLMLDAGVIRPSNSPWCNAVVLVRKKDGSLRFCIDFRKLNSLTVKDSHTLPQTDGRYHPIAYASRIMNDTEQRYHSNKQEFLALKWAVTEQFHEYLSPYGKNRNEFVVRTDNNPLTYIFSSTNLDAAGQRWVAQLASYNFSLEYQKGKDNTVADFLSRLDETLSKEEVQDYLDKIPYPGVKAVLDNTITPLEERAEVGVRPDPEGVKANPEEAVAARAAKLASTNIIDWKVEQKDDPVLYQVVKHLRASRETFKGALLTVLDKKATTAYVKAKEQLLLKNGLLYRKTNIGPAKETIFQFVVPQRHRSAAMDGCHHEAAHQGQRRSTSLMQERFWWPGMARDLRNRIRKCGRCRKFEAAPPIAPMQPLTCSGPGELLHVDFTSIEETVPLKEEPVIRNVLVLQDHFSKYVIAYVVKDQTARTAAVTLRNGYFGLFGAPAYLVSDQGKAFTGHLITHLCELYGVHKLRTSPYHAQTNGQVERMNQTIIRMIGKLAEDKKAHWSEHLPELLSAYNGTRSAVTGYSPYYLLFGRKNRMPVDCLFPTLYESPHRTKMEVSVATMQKRLKEAFEVARRLTYEEATKQRRYYDRRAGAITLQPGDVVMVRTDSFVGKRKVKDRWEDGGFIVESQLGDWPVYKVRCPSADD